VVQTADHDGPVDWLAWTAAELQCLLASDEFASCDGQLILAGVAVLPLPFRYRRHDSGERAKQASCFSISSLSGDQT
jgi:hypothetical protein